MRFCSTIVPLIWPSSLSSVLARAHEIPKDKARDTAACDTAAFVRRDDGVFGDPPQRGTGGGGEKRNMTEGSLDLAVCTWMNIDIAHNLRYKDSAFLRFPLRDHFLVVHLPQARCALYLSLIPVVL